MIKILSFAYRNGVPEADRILDCRVLANPHGRNDLRPLTGMDERIQKFVSNDVRSEQMRQRIIDNVKDGEVIAFGCFGGRHRSVAQAEMLAEALKAKGLKVSIRHRELRESRVL